MTPQKSTVLITGANRGLGYGFVRHYLERGWVVVATATTSEKADGLRKLGDEVGKPLIVEPLDVTREDLVTQFATKLTELGLQLDLVISNAGISVDEVFGKWSAATFESHFRVNTIGPALLAQAVAPLMQQGAKLINVSSGLGSLELNLNPTGPLDAYAMSKAALNILSRRLAAKFESQGITVVSMNPGWVKTDMGGQEAPTTVEEAIGAMAKTIESLSREQSGSFLTSTGEALPW